MQRKRLVAVLVALAFGLVPRSDIRRRSRRDARASGLFLASDEGGRRSKDGVEARVNDGFDVDRVGSCASMDEGDEKAEPDAEHGCA